MTRKIAKSLVDETTVDKTAGTNELERVVLTIDVAEMRRRFNRGLETVTHTVDDIKRIYGPRVMDFINRKK